MTIPLMNWATAIALLVSAGLTHAGQGVDESSPLRQTLPTPAVMHARAPAAATSVSSAIRDVREGDALFFRISATEPTRLSIEGGRISALNFVQEDLDVTQDTALGQAYLKPRNADKAITLYVTTDNNVTATLTLQPTPGPASSIRLRDLLQAQAQAQAPSPRQAVPAVAAEYTKAVEALMTVAAKDLDVSGVDVTQLEQDVRLWRGVRFTLRRRHEAHNMTVETYVLTNQTTAPLRMVEQEFFTKSVAAVAIDHHEVLPGASTVVYVARWVRE
jgi:conjugal transfer pilus assembly protein TraK